MNVYLVANTQLEKLEISPATRVFTDREAAEAYARTVFEGDWIQQEYRGAPPEILTLMGEDDDGWGVGVWELPLTGSA